RLQLWWGESKMKASADSAISDCLTGLANYLPDRGGSSSPLNRDLQLLSEQLDLNDDATQRVILALLDRRSPQFHNTEFCGVGLASFDLTPYPNLDDEESRDGVQGNLTNLLKRWERKAKKLVEKHG